jgi:tripartite-type tricarboxylate transporter receptor subunit TctC
VAVSYRADAPGGIVTRRAYPVRHCLRALPSSRPLRAALPILASVVTCACLALLSTLHANAQPLAAGKAIRIVVPFPPGGSVDVIARLMAARMTEMSGQSFLVENRSGATGVIGTEYVARAAPDGTTLLLNTLPFVVNVPLMGKVPYDPVRDFTPISLVATSPAMLVVHPSVPARNLKELIALARAKSGRMTFSSSGSGSNPHIPAEFMKQVTKTDIVHVPYKGGGPALTAVLGGEVDMSFISLVAVLPHIESKRLRAIAVTSLKRVPLAPDVPTMAESLPGFEFSGWFVLMAPANTPASFVTPMNQLAVKAMQSPEMRDRLTKEGAEALGTPPDQVTALLKSELVRWTRLIRENNIRPE